MLRGVTNFWPLVLLLSIIQITYFLFCLPLTFFPLWNRVFIEEYHL